MLFPADMSLIEPRLAVIDHVSFPLFGLCFEVIRCFFLSGIHGIWLIWTPENKYTFHELDKSDFFFLGFAVSAWPCAYFDFTICIFLEIRRSE